MRHIGWRLGAFALLALLVRAVVPSGYMLATAETASGRYLTVTVCSDHTTTARVIDLETGLEVNSSDMPDGPDGKTADQPSCVFGVAPHMAAPHATVMAATLPVQVSQPVFGSPRDLRPGRGIAAPPPPSTGPPA